VFSSQWNHAAYQNIWISDYGDEAAPKPKITISTGASTNAIHLGGLGIHKLFNLHFDGITHPTDSSSSNPNCVGLATTGTLDAAPGASAEISNCDFTNVAGNAISANGISSATYAAFAAPRLVVLDCTFENIGHDAIFAKVKDYFEVGRCRMTNLSTKTTTGDGVGFLDANPALAWIHNNYIDRSNNDYKQAVIIDGVDGSGLAIVEYNYLVGYGSKDVSPVNHVVLNVDGTRAVIRGNYIEAYGIGLNFNVDGAIVLGNVFKVGNFSSSGNATVSVLASNAQVVNNTFLCDANNIDTTKRLVASGAGRTGNVFRNNIVVGGGVFLRSGTPGTDAYESNVLFGVQAPYVDNAGTPLAGGVGDLFVDPALRSDYMPMSAAVRNAALSPTGRGDFYGKPLRGTIGAVQYQPAKTTTTRTVTTRTAATRSVAAKRVATV
jgi:hypothetical protein